MFAIIPAIKNISPAINNDSTVVTDEYGLLI